MPCPQKHLAKAVAPFQKSNGLMRKPGQNCVVLDTAPMQNNPCNYFHNTNTREKRLKTENCVHVLSNTCQHFQRSCSWLDLNLTFNCFPFAQMGVCNLLFTFLKDILACMWRSFPQKSCGLNFFGTHLLCENRNRDTTHP